MKYIAAFFLILLIGACESIGSTKLPPPRDPPINPNPGKAYTEAYGWKIEFQPKLIYPTSAATKGVQGWVVVRHSIELDGTTSEIEVVDSSPPEIFNETAKRSVQKLRFVPLSDSTQPRRMVGARRLLTYTLK